MFQIGENKTTYIIDDKNLVIFLYQNLLTFGSDCNLKKYMI